MNKKSLNTNNVEVPPVVQNKINLAILQIKSEEENSMKNISIKKPIKMLIAASVCAAVFVCSIFATNIFNNNKISTNPVGATDTSSNSSWNPFVIKVMAAELEPDTVLPISIVGAPDAFYLGGYEFDNSYSTEYNINLPISCQGENIDSITYSINNGAFQIIEPSYNPYVISGVETDCNIQTQIYDNTYDTSQINDASTQSLIINVPETENQSVMVYDSDSNLYDSKQVKPAYYKEFTVNYDTQSSNELIINICDTLSDAKEIFNLIYGDEYSEENITTALNMLLKDVKISITANYSDGTTDTKTIGLEAKTVALETTEFETGVTTQLFVKEI